MSVVEKILEKGTRTAEWIAGGFHAVPPADKDFLRTLPSQHRLLNVIGMAAGFSAMKYLGDIAYGHKINGGEYEEIKKEKVPKILRPLHGIIHNNPFSDDPHEQWLKVMHQLLPAIGGAVGAIKGSDIFFESRGGKAVMELLRDKKVLTPLEAEKAISFKQGKKWGVGAGLNAWMGSVTGLTGLGYGGTLNPAFMLRNQGKAFAGFVEILEEFGISMPAVRKFSNTQGKSGFGPNKAMEKMGGWVETMFDDIKKTGNVNAAVDKLGDTAGRNIVLPFISKATPQQQEHMVTRVRTMVEEAYKAEKDPAKMKANIQGHIKDLLTEMKVGPEFKNIFLEGDNGMLGRAMEAFNKKEFDEIRGRVGGASSPVQDKPKSHFLAKALGVGAGVGVIGYGAKKIHDTKAHAQIRRAPEDSVHSVVSVTPGMTAEEYVAATHKINKEKEPKGAANGGLLNFARWVGDASLAVVPKNRFFCSLGLTAGGGLGLYTAKILAGQNLADNTKILKEDVPALLKPLHGLFKFDPHSSAMKDRWGKLGALYTFTALSMVGIMVGAKHAYKSANKANENPDSLEDYAARVGQHQGDKWRFLAATSGIFGSTSGFFALPFVPGVNYGSSVAFYTVLNQDRKVMTPGLRSATGTKTTSYLGLREGLEYMTKYAEYNPSKNPAELEYLALTVLGPLADASGTKLSATQIKSFVDKIHTVRDQYWQEGGIPKDRKEDFKLEIDKQFKGKGLDKTLYDCGFDTLKIDFLKMNGLIGKLGNKLGAKEKILKDQEAYREMVQGWRSEWPQKDPALTAGDSPTLQPEMTLTKTKAFTDRVKPATSRFADMPPLSYQDRVALDEANASKSMIRAD